MNSNRRVVAHVHSDWSYDGSWPLERIAQLFSRLGVNLVLMTEHDTGFAPSRFAEYRRACEGASTRRCRLVPGIEYSSPDNRVHLLTWGLAHFLAEHRPVEETLARVAEGGGVAVFAHPARQDAWRLMQADWLPLLAGIEIWNRKTDGVAPGAAALRLHRETGLAALVGIDFHRARQLWPLDHVMSSDDIDPERAVVEALQQRALRPRAFSAPLLDETDRRVRAGGVHMKLEAVRRGLRGRRRP